MNEGSDLDVDMILYQENVDAGLIFIAFKIMQYIKRKERGEPVSDIL